MAKRKTSKQQQQQQNKVWYENSYEVEIKQTMLVKENNKYVCSLNDSRNVGQLIEDDGK